MFFYIMLLIGFVIIMRGFGDIIAVNLLELMSLITIILFCKIIYIIIT